MNFLNFTFNGFSMNRDEPVQDPFSYWDLLPGGRKLDEVYRILKYLLSVLVVVFRWPDGRLTLCWRLTWPARQRSGWSSPATNPMRSQTPSPRLQRPSSAR